ncbi:hypothetical protein QZM44_33885 [Burkholderia seminalis]|nr:hypothetical protein [Burkholderia seminalis]MDN7591901.1 hypothetical protein [Burkholderia seminalis]
MRQRLSEVLGRLYRPPADDVRQVFALSRDDAEKLPRLSSLAIISITAPERPPACLYGFDYLLRLSFADVDFLKPELSRKANEKLSRAFTPKQARMVRSFVEGLPDTITSIVVHCEGGYSRSCAIALGLHRLYGYRVDKESLVRANPSVLSVMIEGR